MLVKLRRLAPPLQLLLALVFLSVAHGEISGQQTAARPDRGVNPGGSYSVSDIENINMQSGNVQLSIPLASLPPIAGGKLSFGLSLNYNSKLWNVTRNELEGSALPYRTYVVDTPQLSDVGGWSVGGTYGIFLRDAREDFNYGTPPSPDPNDGTAVLDYQQVTLYQWKKMILRTPDGAEHELRPVGNYPWINDPSHRRPYLWGYYRDTPYTTGTPIRYNSSDGTYLSAIVNPANHASGISWTIFLPDGTQIISYFSGFQRIKDNNGNSIKIFSDANGMHYQDEQTGREIRTTYDPQGGAGYGQARVWYRAVGGVEHHIDINYGVTVVRGKTYDVQDWNPTAYDEQTGNYGAECRRQQELVPATVEVVREIVFPATGASNEANELARRFTFTYNSDAPTVSTTTESLRWMCGNPPESYTRQASPGLGELSEMVTPSGARVNYTYTQSLQHDFIGYGLLLSADHMARATLTEKELTHDGTTDTWTYDIPNESNSSVSTVNNPDGSSITQNYFPTDPNFPQIVGTGAGAKNGLVFSINNGVTQTLRQWVSGTQLATGSNTGMTTLNPLVAAEYTKLVGTSMMSGKVYQHDANGNVTQTAEYDWFDTSQVTIDGTGVPTGPPAGVSPVSVTNTSFHNSAPNTSSANYYGVRSLASGTPSILNAVQQTALGPAITQISYDGQAYGVAPTAGNVTSQSVWDDLDNKWITSSQTYTTPYGNLETRTDARGNVTHFYYDDLTHAKPNRVVVDPENGTGTQTSTTVYDFYTGAVTSQTDANGKVSDINYTNHLLGAIDPFARPGITYAPAVDIGGVPSRRQVRTFYEDGDRRVRVESDLNAQDDRLLKTQTTNDQLGRPILSETSEDGTTYSIKSNMVYLQMGRITLTSNPWREDPGTFEPETTNGWTRTTKDSVGRVIEVASFHGAAQPAATGETNGAGKVLTAYDTIFTTVTDQAGNVRRSKTDGLGRLVRVDEPDASTNNLGTAASPVQPTSYEYDVFGNLKTVAQGSQTRTFNYDSLSRLRSAVNPESGTSTYVYDDNGNRTQKTDARSIVSTYVYDALNRATSRSYSDGTPTVTYNYDSAAISNGKGRLASVSSSVSSYSYSGYDATGKALGASQAIGSQTYTLAYGYDLAGNVKTMTYPSGRTVNYAYDAAGRLNSAAGNLGGAQRNYSTGIVYDAGGRMTQEQFGTTTALFNKLFYNVRGQLAEIRVGTTGNNTDWERGAIINHYSNTNCWGAACNSTNNNGNLMKQEIHIPGQDMKWQQYGYDRLNRLTSVREVMNGNDQWRQTFTYDRFGNRRIDTNPSQTWGGVNNLDFELETSNNRLYAPGDLALPDASRRMQYDPAGNLKTDTYTGQGQRTYDAENRMKQAWAANQWQTYHYDGDGRRVKRIVNGVETWQVYGLGGELLAEYAQNAAAASPQKEYGYRNGQLLITATAGTSWGSAPSFGSPNPLVAGETVVKASHITDLRTAINDLRAHMSLGAYSWQFSATTNDYISANPIIEMRAALDQALSAPSPAYAAGLAQGQLVKAVHIQELRDRVLAAWSLGTALEINWLVADQLGTPRMIFDQTGSLAKRHDYLPFGEELSTQGGRTTAQGYSADDTRQKFTSKERDTETGLDYFIARYYSSTQGRFTSPDEFKGGPEELFGEVDPHDPLFYSETAEPQSLNKYQYCLNNPLRYVDPDGHQTATADALKLGATLTIAGPHPVVKGIGVVILAGVGVEVTIGWENVGKAGKALLDQGGKSAARQDMEDLRTLRGGGQNIFTKVEGGATGSSAPTQQANTNSASEPPKEKKGGETKPKKEKSAEGARVQRENIEKAQTVHRKAGRPDRIRSIEKSKQNERNELKKIKTSKDAPE